MVEEILQGRFQQVVDLPHGPPLAAGEAPGASAVLVPTWKDFSADQLNAAGEVATRVVLELALLRRDGTQVWSKSFVGSGRGIGTGAEGCEGMPRIASAALEEAGAALATELSRPETIATVTELRSRAAVQQAVDDRDALRQGARRLYVHPFAGKGSANPALATALERDLVARLLASARFVGVASGAQQAAVDAAIRDVNRDGTTEGEWVAIGKGRGAELMLTGEVTGAGSACTVKVELTDLSNRLVLASFFRPVNPCETTAVAAQAEPAAQAMIGGL
jgi:hypothetical protein